MSPRALVLAVGGRIDPADIGWLVERARRAIVGSDAAVVTCDVGELADPDAVTVDALARIELVARRHGRSIRFRRASCELRELLVLMGLGDFVAPR